MFTVSYRSDRPSGRDSACSLQVPYHSPHH